MRKSVILSALMVGAMAGITPALAADEDMPPEFRSSTFEVYMGVFGAADTIRSNYTNNEADADDLIAGDLDGTGFGYGLRGGFDYVMDGWVLGAVGDWSFGQDLASDSRVDSDNVEVGLPNLGTLRARAGVTLGNSLWYLTGGLAHAEIEGSAIIEDLEVNSTVNRWSTSWTVGGGIDVGITDSLSLGVEYLYVDVDNNSFSFGTDDPDEPLALDYEIDGIHTVRVGMNYAFRI
jgi:opacity protein-like surface antigen